MADVPPFFFRTGPSQPAFSVETPIRAFEPARPFPQNPSAIIYRTRFMQLRAYYARPVANTAHPNLPQVYFADDVDFQDRPGGVMEWTRVYVTLPSSWVDYESYAYTFPGYIFGTGPLNRTPITKTVTARINNDYFLVGTLPNYLNNLASGDDLNNAAWTATAITVTGNSGATPACAGGTNVAAKLVPSGNAAVHSIAQSVGLSVGAVLGDIFVKSAGYTRVEMQLDDLSPNLANIVVNLDTGLIERGTYNYAEVAAIGDGWWRLNLGRTTTNANVALNLLVMNGNSYAYTGDGVSGVYAWRGQLVPGSSVPTPTIAPTLTADATNYPIASAGNILSKFGQQYLYAWTGTPTPYLATTSNPSYNTYIALVNTDQANANANSYSIQATDSELSLFSGSVWARASRFVKAR